MTLVTFDFESATPSGTTLTTGNTGANQILTNTGTAVSDNTVDVWSGSLCGKFVGPLNNQCLARFLASSSNLTMSFGGGFSIDAQPANAISLCTMRGSGLAASLRWGTTNGITFNNAAGTSLGTLVTGATPGSKYWASIRITTTASANTGTWAVNIYDSTGTLVGGGSGSAANLGTAAFTGGDFGVVDASHAAGVTVRWDYVQFNDGSAVEITPPVTSAAATGTAAVSFSASGAGGGAGSGTSSAVWASTGAAGGAGSGSVSASWATSGTAAGATAGSSTATFTTTAAPRAAATGTATVTVTATATAAAAASGTAVITWTATGTAATQAATTGATAWTFTTTATAGGAGVGAVGYVWTVTGTTRAGQRDLNVTVTTGPTRHPTLGTGQRRHPTITADRTSR